MYSININISDLIDNQYKHTHHADSIKLLEKARCAFSAHIGFPVEDYIDKGLFIVVTNLEVSYSREVKDDEVRVSIESFEFRRGRIMKAHQKIYNKQGEVSVSANLEFMFFSVKDQRVIKFPKEYQEAMAAYFNKES